MDIATGTWFKYLRENEKKPKKPKCKTLLTEISRGEHEKLQTWIMNQGDINPELDDVFGGPGKMRVAFPMGGEDVRNLAQIVSALMSESWYPPRINNAGVKKFKTKEVKQKGKRRVGELPPDFGMPHPETNPDPRPVEEYYEDKWVAELNLEKTYDFTIPAGPRKGEKIKKTDKTTMSRAIGKLAKQGKIDEELLEWWNQKQIYYTNDNKWEDVQELFDMTSTEHKYSIIVSRAPIDILRMSDIGRITSCHKEGGEYFQCAREEARGHGIVAYRLYTDVLEGLLTEKTTEGKAQELVVTTILQHYQRYKTLRKNLNDAELFEFGVDAIKREWRNQPQEVMDAVTYDMVREAIRTKDDFNDLDAWPPPDINPEAELKPLSDFDDEEIFQDTDRDISGIIANERVRMRKFYDAANHQYFVVPEHAPYGAKQPGFVNVVRSWAWDNQKDLFIDDDGELQPPRPQDLTRFGGSWEDTKDGTILNSFFNEARPDDTYEFKEFGTTNMRQDTGEEEEDENNMEGQLDEAEEQIEEILSAASNRSEHVTFSGEANLDDDGEHIYVYGSADVTLVFPIGWEGIMIPRETGYYFTEEERDVKTMPKSWGSDYQTKRAFTEILERHIESYSEDTDWNVEPALGSGYELRVHLRFNCEDCGDVDDFDNFVDYVISDVDGKYDESYEKTRRELVDEGYLPPNDWDNLLDDVKESNEELENWRAYGLDADEYDGEVIFYFEPEGYRKGGIVPLGVIFPKEIGNTPYALEKVFKDDGRVGGGAGFSGPGQVWPGVAFMERLDVVFSDLQERANGYAEEQLDLNFGDKYSRPAFDGVKFSENAQLRFKLAAQGENKPSTVEMYLKLDIKSTESKEEIEGAMAFMKYVDQYPDEIIKGVRDNFKAYMDEYSEYVKVRAEKMEDGTTFQQMFERIRSKFEAQSDQGNTDAEQAILLAMWGRDNWGEMNKVEKHTLIDSYMRPLISGGMHARNSWSAMSDLPLNWNNFVQSKMRSEGFGAPRHVWRGYSWATHHPDSDQAGLSDEQKERAKVLAWLYRNEHGPTHGGPVRPAGWSDADWKLVITEIPDLERFADEPGHEGQAGEGVGYYDRGRRAREASRRASEEGWNDPLGTRRRAAARQDQSSAMDALVSGDAEEFSRLVGADEDEDEPDPHADVWRRGAQEDDEEEDKPGDAYKRAKEAAKARKAARGGDRPMEEQILKVDNMLNEIFDLRLYKMQIQLLVRKLEGREIDDLKNEIRGIKHVTTVKTVRKRRIADAYRVVLELKYEQMGVIARDTFIRFELVPALRKFPAIEIEDWSKPEKVERTMTEEKRQLNEFGTEGIPPSTPTQSKGVPTPRVVLKDIAQDWMDGGVQVYDTPMNTLDMRYHVMIPVEELWPYASRVFRGPKDVFDDNMTAYQEFIANGADSPVYVAIGMNGRIKITGNEDIVWFAKKSGRKEVPVFLSYQKQV